MEPTTVLTFWFGPLDADGLAQEQHAQRWWRKDAAFDQQVRTQFSAVYHDIVAGGHKDWLASAHSGLAYVIVLDQFSRNMFRDQAQAFAADAQALEVAKHGVDLGHDQQLRGHERLFLYLPFMHSELLQEQERCVALLTAFRDASQGKLREALAYNIKFAEQHRDIIARFGRFPHRNAQLGRPSSEEEKSFLTQPGSSF